MEIEFSSQKTTIVDINKICRMCLSTQNISPLIKCKYYNTYMILQKFWDEEGKLTRQLFLPNICQDCCDELKLVHSFMTKLETSTDKLFERNINSPQNSCAESRKQHLQISQDEGNVDSCSYQKVFDPNTEKINIIEDVIKDEKYQFDSETKELRCITCSLTFKHYRNLQSHFQMHKKIIKKNQSFVECKTTKTESDQDFCDADFKENIDDVHSVCNYQCEFCGKIYKDEILLKIHQEAVHRKKVTKIKSKSSEENKNANGQYVCNYCEKIFSVKSNLSRHRSIIHEKCRRYNCHICGESFTVKNTLKYHLYIHSNTKPFKCNICNTSFRQPNALKRHKKTKHVIEKKFECSICLKKLKSPATLKKHQSKMHVSN